MRKVALTLIGLAIMVVSVAATVATKNLWQEPVLNLWQTLPDNLAFLRERVVENWRDFLGLAPKAEVLMLAASSTPNEIQQFVDQRVREELSDFLNQGKTSIAGRAGGGGSSAQGGQGPSSGLIVVPTTGNELSDEAIKARLKEVFSDQVVVKYDPAGTTGVITPIFQRGRGQDYLFLLTPIRPK
ncbi:MAG: hypothetical protein HYT48_01600 [Candidatus Vogelbacteria bacterium]|nr:hypothetical protein [Candidatus Vogelbacteria bacterium]